MTVHANAYNAWMTDYPELDPAERDPLSNPAGDGVPNLLKFALGLSPMERVNGPVVLHSLTEDGGNRHLTLSFSVRTGASGTAGDGYVVDGIRYWVEFSTDLNAWHRGSAYVEQTGSPGVNGNGTETFTVRVRDPMSSANRQFIRLLVEEVTNEE